MMGEHAKLYNTTLWRRLRLYQLTQSPLCALCTRGGRTTPATVADHVTPHKGDTALFFDSNNLQSLCGPCHNGAKKEQEMTGVLRGCDVNGLPLDDSHAWNQEVPHGCSRT